MRFFLNLKNYYFFILLISLISLISVFYIEYILEEIPCKLCQYQRIPYFIAIFITLFSIIINKNLFFVYILTIIFLSSFLLSVYHVGIENNVFPEFSGCVANNLKLLDKTEILKSMSLNLPNCSSANFKILGLSLATINSIISAIIMLLGIKIINYEKNK